ncbi:MAG: O-6-methylguanine DNA methyltransferase [Myxococcota bacterium]
MSTLIPARVVESPIGDLLVAVGEAGVRALEILGSRTLAEGRHALTRKLGAPVVEEPHALLRRVQRELSDFFEGKRRFFTVPLALDGTPFQRQVWDVLVRLPYGETLAYGELAEMMGRPTATRAVANACSRNPVPILVPCHRVIASDGDLGGFAAGLAAKRKLLTLERSDLQGLPLFRVLGPAQDDRPSVADGIPARLQRWLSQPPEERPIGIDAWLCDVMASVPVNHWPTLAQELAAQKTTESEALAEELLEAYAAEIRHHWPTASGLTAFLKLSAARDMHAFESTLHRLRDAHGRPHGVTDAIVRACVDLMNGKPPCKSRARELAVDAWLALDPMAAEKLAALMLRAPGLGEQADNTDE